MATISIDIDLDEFSTKDLMQELSSRGLEFLQEHEDWDEDQLIDELEARDGAINIVRTPSLVQKEKLDFFVEHIEYISLESLERLVK